MIANNTVLYDDSQFVLDVTHHGRSFPDVIL